MSHDIVMVDVQGKVLLTKHPAQGGTYVAAVLNPTTNELDEPTAQCDLNVTYNYSWFYYKFFDKEKGISWIYGKKGSECVDRLERAIEELTTPNCFGDGRHPYEKDYWAPTVGNAVVPLKAFLEWSKEHPDGIFKGD